MSQLKPIIEQAMTQYAGAVLQSRALIDVRDALKPSARQILYCMDKYKYTADKPYQKTMAAIGDAMKHFYIHGDSSCEGIIMRAGQSFAMRYPLVSIKGNGGNLMESGNWGAPRYTEARLAKITASLFEDIEKEIVKEWRDNYSETEQYPSVLPSKGFYNIVNGSQGIGIGMASSIPQFNIKDVNAALAHLLDNPDCSFEEIYCAPDFATGAVLINESEVKQSLKNGNGFACKLRSVVEFDSKERCFVVTEIPYGVYTNTICGELEELVNSGEDIGIDRFIDLTGTTPLLKIYLNKKANPDKVLRYLYKNTSLQYYYGINLTMLDNGRFPRVFTWKEALQAHINHEVEVYRRGFEFDLHKIRDRIHIIDGLLICMASIDEVVHTIKESKSAATASVELQKKFLLDEAQAKAVLDMKLSRLAHLEVEKLENERAELENKAEQIEKILNSTELLHNEIKKGWAEIAKKYGDARRTKILDLKAEAEEPIEIKKLQVSLTNHNNILVTETSTLYTQKRGGVGNKVKLEGGEAIIDSRAVDSNEEILFFTNSGNVYHCPAHTFPIGEKTSLFNQLALKEWEKICAITASTKTPTEKYIIFITKQGYIKKTELSEYNTNRKIGLRAINLNEGDEIIDVVFGNTPNIGILTELGNFLIVSTADVRATGRTTQGVHGAKLNDGDNIIAAHAIPEDTKFIVSISGCGLFKRTNYSEFSIQGKNTKGSKLQKLNDGDWMADFLPLSTESDILITATRSSIKLTFNDIPIFSKGALGNKSIKLNAQDNVARISKY